MSCCDEEPTSMPKKSKWDTYDVEDAARTLIKAQRISTDTRKGFYAAVKIEVTKQAEAAAKEAIEAKTAARLHNFRKKVDS